MIFQNEELFIYIQWKIEVDTFARSFDDEQFVEERHESYSVKYFEG